MTFVLGVVLQTKEQGACNPLPHCDIPNIFFIGVQLLDKKAPAICFADGTRLKTEFGSRRPSGAELLVTEDMRGLNHYECTAQNDPQGQPRTAARDVQFFVRKDSFTLKKIRL